MVSEHGLSIGQRIRQQRERLNWSQERLAESVGATKMSVRRWEHDTVLPQPYYREQLCRVFNVASEVLFGVQEAEIAAPAPATGDGIWHVPHLRNPFFTGREEILQRMHTILSHEKTATLTQSYALSGLGGIGKTQTAIEYAYRYAPQYAAVLWIGAETHESLVSSFVTLADMLNLPEKQDQEQKRVISAVTRWLNSHEDWLLIFDNVEDIELVKGFLPPARSGSLLLTSRKQALGLTAQTLDLEKMTPEEGMRFLLHRARLLEPEASLDQLSAEDKAIAQEIVTAMDGLPLALDQAGAYIEATQCSLRDFLHIFQTYALHLLNKRDPHADHPASVVKTFALVFEQLQQVNPQAAELLTMCAFLAPDTIPEELFKAGASQLGDAFVSLAADPWQFNAVFEDLLAYSLIRRNPEYKTFTVHRLVQAVFQDRLKEAEQCSYVERMMLAVNATFPDVEYDSWSQCERLLPHAFRAAQLIKTHHILRNEAGRLLYQTALYLKERARYHEAESLYQQALHIQEQGYGYEHPQIAYPLYGLAELYRVQSRYEEAEPLYLRALSIRERQLGPEHFLMAAPLAGLAALYFEQGKYEEAEPLYLRALSTREQQLGPEHLDVTRSLNGLANLYQRQGKYEEAEPLYLRALSIRERQLGPEHPLMASPLNGLAALYFEQGRYEEAESLYLRALSIRERQLGPEHPDVAVLLNNLALCYSEQGRYVEAELLFQRALHIREQRSGPEHSEVAYPLYGLAELYRAQGRYVEAESLFLRGWRIWEQHFGTEHPRVAYFLNSLANLYFEQGRYVEAEQCYQQALHIREQQLGPEHPDVAETLHYFARFQQTQGNCEAAKSLYTRALAIRVQALGAHHPYTMKTRKHLIALLYTMGLDEEATELEIVR